MVYLDGDRLYTELDKYLNVYLINDLTSPIATYPLKGRSKSCILANNCLYLNGGDTLYVFKVSTSLTQPLIRVSQIPAPEKINTIVRMGGELVLGMNYLGLSVFDIESCKITHYDIIEFIGDIYDIIILDGKISLGLPPLYKSKFNNLSMKFSIFVL